MTRRTVTLVGALALIIACSMPGKSTGTIVQSGGATLFTLLSPQPYVDARHTEPSVFFPGSGRTVMIWRDGPTNDLRRYHNDDPGFAAGGIVDDGASSGFSVDLPHQVEAPGISTGIRYMFHSGVNQDLHIYAKKQPLSGDGLNTWTAVNGGAAIVEPTTYPPDTMFNRLYNCSPMIDPVDPTIIHLWIESGNQEGWNAYFTSPPGPGPGYWWGSCYVKFQADANGDLTEIARSGALPVMRLNHSNPIYDPSTGKILFVGHQFEQVIPQVMATDGFEVANVAAYVVNYSDNLADPASYRRGDFLIKDNASAPNRRTIADTHIWQFPAGQGYSHKLLMLGIPSAETYAYADYRMWAWVSDSTITELIEAVEISVKNARSSSCASGAIR